MRFQVACFLHDQMPIRLANRAKELESLRILRECPHIALVCNWYKQVYTLVAYLRYELTNATV